MRREVERLAQLGMWNSKIAGARTILERLKSNSDLAGGRLEDSNALRKVTGWLAAAQKHMVG